MDARGGRTAFEVFVAILAALAVVFGMYALGRAMDDDDEGGRVEAVDAAPTPGTEVDVAGAVASLDDPAAHDAGAHDDAATHEEVDDRGFSELENGEQHGHSFTQPLDSATRTELARQLALARDVALQYPTVADAEAAGYRRAGPFSPGLGAHYINFGNAAASFGGGDDVWNDDDIRAPLAYIYDGVESGSRIAGLFYSGNGSEAPEGFAGPNDTWHKHSNICIVTGPDGIDTPLGADRDVDPADCTAVGGSLIQQTGYLLHVWVVPGYESPEGVFSHLSSAVTCPDGTYYTIDRTEIGSANTICRDAQ
ncbi:MAG: hypothetical protein ACT4OX_03900 [Actinomycetota bacterium]